MTLRGTNPPPLLVFQDEKDFGLTGVLDGLLGGRILHTTRREPKNGPHLIVDHRANTILPVLVDLETRGRLAPDESTDAYWQDEGFPGRVQALRFLSHMYRVPSDRLPDLHTIALRLVPPTRVDGPPRCPACQRPLTILQKGEADPELRAIACPTGCFTPRRLFTNEDPSVIACACGCPQVLGKTDAGPEHRSWKKHAYTRCLIDCPNTAARCPHPGPNGERCGGPSATRRSRTTTNVFFKCRRCRGTWS